MNERQVAPWLPKDERRLLAYYFTKLKRPKTPKSFKNPMELMKALGYRQGKKEKPEDSPYLWRVMDANESLVERGLAVITQDSMGMDITVGLTLKGRDLGEKYADTFVLSGLWFAEYKHHWIWVIMAAILTFFIGWLVGMLTK